MAENEKIPNLTASERPVSVWEEKMRKYGNRKWRNSLIPDVGWIAGEVI